MNETIFTLQGFQRSYLKKLAHHLHPIVTIGKGGLSAEVLSALDDSLLHHELVKVKFQDFKEDKRDLLEAAAQGTRAEFVALVGNVGILYRPNYDLDERIRVPKRKA